MPQPAQKPHRSKQDYATPQVFIEAVKIRLGIKEFAFDFAADELNTKARRFWSEADNSLSLGHYNWAGAVGSGWGWLNPPFSDIGPWAARCAQLRHDGGSVAFLAPAGVGANWYRDFVDKHALVLALNGRLSFDGVAPYPKDLLLCLYQPNVPPGFEVWNWRETRRAA